MRFRVPNTGGQQAADGVGNFFRSLAMAPMAEAQAADAAQQEQAKRSLLGAQTEQAQSMARFNNAKADQEADQLQRRGLGGMIGDAAMANGVAPYQVPDFVKYAQTGQMPQRYSPPPVDGVGPYEPAPAIYQDDTASKIWKMLGLNNQTLAFDRGNVADVAKATGEYRDQGLGDSVLSGAANPGQVAQSQAAVAGKALFNNIGNTGAGFNQFTGAEQTLNPGMLTLFGDQGRQGIALDKAREGASVAQAGASKASAANSYASAAKARQERQQGARSGDIVVVPGPDGSIQLVNKVTGETRNAVGADGKPTQGKGAGGAAMNLSEGERKAATLLTRLRGSQAQMLSAIGKNPGAEKPLMAAEFVRSIPFVGGNTPANLITPSARQQVEAAQLDILDAALTLGTGAAYTREQLEGYRKSYFPQIGDGDGTIADKQARLENVIRAAEIAAGRAEKLTPRSDAPTPGSGYTGSWGEPSGQPRNVTVEY